MLHHNPYNKISDPSSCSKRRKLWDRNSNSINGCSKGVQQREGQHQELTTRTTTTTALDIVVDVASTTATTTTTIENAKVQDYHCCSSSNVCNNQDDTTAIGTTSSSPEPALTIQPTAPTAIVTERSTSSTSSAVTSSLLSSTLPKQQQGQQQQPQPQPTCCHLSDLVISASDKAGMNEIDRIAIDTIIERTSGNSLYMQQQRKRNEKVNERIVVLQNKLQQHYQRNKKIGNANNNRDDDVNHNNSIERQLEKDIIQPSLQKRPIRSCKVVIDMDMFYMACELVARRRQNHNIDIDHDDQQPACVGNMSMITTSNYAARKYGVRSAMPGYIGATLVQELSNHTQQLHFYPLNFPLYQQQSQVVRTILSQYDPTYIKMYSLDEAYIDLAPYLYYTFRYPQWTHEQISYALHRKVMNVVGGAEETKNNNNNASSNCSSSSKVNLTFTSDSRIREQQNNNNSNSISISKNDTANTNHWMNPIPLHLSDTYGDDDDDDCNDEESDNVDVVDHHKNSCHSLRYYYDQLLQYTPNECMVRIQEIVTNIRERVRSITGGLTCSAGMAPNVLLAKIASDMNKPNGQYYVPSDPESILQFLHPLPIRKVSGIGRVTEKILRSFHIVTVQQLYQERAIIPILFDKSSSTTHFLIRASVGCGSNDSISPNDDDDDDDCNENDGKIGNEFIDFESNQKEQQQKGISRERTIPSGKTWAEVNSKLVDIACLLSKDMAKKQLSARTIYVKVKLHTYDLLSRGRTLPNGTYIHSSKDLVQVATELFHEIRQKGVWGDEGSSTSITDPSVKRTIDNNTGQQQDRRQRKTLFSVRLIGIRCTNFLQRNDDNDVIRMTANPATTRQTTIDQFLCSATSNSKLHKQEAMKKDLSLSMIQNNDAIPLRKANNPMNIFLHKCSTNPALVRGSNTDRPTNKVDRTSNNSNWVRCPICSVQIINYDNDRLNRHIDTCLNGKTIH